MELAEGPRREMSEDQAAVTLQKGRVFEAARFFFIKRYTLISFSCVEERENIDIPLKIEVRL